jgi:hypothetical protein
MRLVFASLALASSLSFAAYAEPAVTQKEVIIGFSEVFVPTGFTSASEAYVIVSGLFPNSCYKWLRADVTPVAEFVHQISAVAAVSQGLCMMVMVPFQKEINLGRLPSGQHTLRFINGDGTFFEKVLAVN